MQGAEQHEAMAADFDDEPALQEERDTDRPAGQHHLGGQKGELLRGGPKVGEHLEVGR